MNTPPYHLFPNEPIDQINEFDAFDQNISQNRHGHTNIQIGHKGPIIMTSKKSRGRGDGGDAWASIAKIEIGGEGQPYQCSVGGRKDDGFVQRESVSFEVVVVFEWGEDGFTWFG